MKEKEKHQEEKIETYCNDEERFTLHREVVGLKERRKRRAGGKERKRIEERRGKKLAAKKKK